MEIDTNLHKGLLVKIKHGARVFFNFGANSLKYDKRLGWIISQVHEDLAKETGKCYTKKIFFDGDVEIIDPEIIYANDLVLTIVRLGNDNFHVLKEDLVLHDEKDDKPPKNWTVNNIK